jgi:hypothetical protein
MGMLTGIYKTEHPSILIYRRLFSCPSILIMNTIPEQILDIEDGLIQTKIQHAMKIR